MPRASKVAKILIEWAVYFILLNLIVFGTGCGANDDEACVSQCLAPCNACAIRVSMPDSCNDCHECIRACKVSHGRK